MNEAPVNTCTGEWTQSESPRFVNAITYGPQLLPEICRRADQARTQLLSVVLLMYFLLGVLLFFADGSSILLWISVLLLPLLMSRWTGRRAVRQSMARAQVLYGEPEKQILSFDEDKVTILSLHSGGRITLPYARIRRVNQSRHCFFLEADCNALLLSVDKAGFQRGNPQDFLPFIQGKLAQAGRKPGASRWSWLRTLGRVLGLMLLIFSVVNLSFSIRDISSIHSSSDYTDMGLRSFAPDQVLSVQDDRHSHKTVYLVEYVAEGGTPYRHRSQGFPDIASAQDLFDQGPIDLRVVIMPGGQGFFVLPPEQELKDYLDTTRGLHLRNLALSGGYLLCYGAIWLVIVWKRRERPGR